VLKIRVNQREIEAERGENLLEVIRRAGFEIPTLCYLKEKGSASNPCGLCVVKIKDEGIVRSCSYILEREIEVETDISEIKEIRKKILEGLVANHYGDCKAPCHTPCPGGLNIQGYIGFIAKGDFKASLALIKEKLPLPAVVGRVCPRFCEPVCRRALVDQAVAINNLKRFVADYCLEHGELPLELPPLKDKRVAVIGAGPAGISCAYFLRLKGYRVTVFDKEEEPGGLLRYGIPSFKLPREVLKKELENIFKLGITFQGGRAWGKDFTLKDLKESGFEAIFIATGSRKERFFGFQGEELAESGLQFLYNFNKGLVDKKAFEGKKIALLGCSYTALELSRVLIRLGCTVNVYYPRSRMEVPVPQREVGYAQKEGVNFVYVTAPWILERAKGTYKVTFVRTSLTEKREIKPLPETAFEEEFDYVFRAWGEVPSPEFKEFGELESQLEVNSEGVLKVNSQTLSTNIEGVFAGGDFIYGSKTVIQAVASGRKAAQTISAYFEGRPPEKTPITVKYDFSRGKRAEEFDSNFLDLFVSEERAQLKERDPKERVGDFEEVLIGLTEEEALKEANRCLRCGCLGIHKCEFRELLIKEDVGVAKARKKIKYAIQKAHPLIEVDSNKCIACERCVRACPYSAIFFRVVHKGKPTEHITFRFTENCVNCGACVDACPTGALIKKNLLVPYSRANAKAVKSVCGYCGVGCNLTVWVKNGTILEVTGRDLAPNYGNTCVKGRFGFEFYKSEERLVKPLLRKDRMKDFEEVSWERALEFVAENLVKIRDKYGPQALAFLCSARTSNEENYLMQKIARGIFKTNNVDNPARV
jgi:formate dehydrogenase major subunit